MYIPKCKIFVWSRQLSLQKLMQLEPPPLEQTLSEETSKPVTQATPIESHMQAVRRTVARVCAATDQQCAETCVSVQV